MSLNRRWANSLQLTVVVVVVAVVVVDVTKAGDIGVALYLGDSHSANSCQKKCYYIFHTSIYCITCFIHTIYMLLNVMTCVLSSAHHVFILFDQTSIFSVGLWRKPSMSWMNTRRFSMVISSRMEVL